MSTAALHRTLKRPSGGWAACMIALAASATAATSAAALRSDETRLESGRIGFGTTMHVLSHFTQQQQQQKRNTAVLTSGVAAAEHEALLMARNTHRWVQASTLRTKKIQHEYDMQGVIGEGGFGRVHIARHRATNAQVAIKRVFKEGTTKEKFLQEVAILRHLNGGNSSVLQLREAFETADAYVLVTELVQGGELYDNLVENGVFDEHRASSLTREIAQTLAFLHTKSVVHGDIKPENILLSETNNKNSSGMRLIDFGQAFREDKVHERVRAIGSGVGTTAYAAPESIRRSEASAAVDVWALGVVLYIVLCGRHPFDPTNDSSDDEMTTRILAGDFECDSREWECMSEQARDLIQRMLTVDASARITAEEVLAHEWIQGAISA